ncbi:MFS transporter [Streptomyces sp. LX-29]|uniref:MFS transporter n=1 Tax=Streptomyces sp. LX-29 TaxID=2900152 RepID=UPI00240E143B|nr:MFS transporter [Streptomyces sp. LX-29]WFB09629.1 MFS transporter [Streptomyces sp. LX-29]
MTNTVRATPASSVHPDPSVRSDASARPEPGVAADRAGDASGGPPSRSAPRPGWLLAIVLTGLFMALLDVFIVNVAAPTLAADLHASGAGLQLVITGYTIAYAVLLITGARIGARIGHRRAFLAGLAVFTAASLACGLAPNTGSLIAFRVVQGTGSALMLPQVLSLIQRTYTGSSRARALGAYSAVLASGAAAGQIVGGVLVSADLFGAGWRPVFLVNVPIGVLLLVVGPRLMPRDRVDAAAASRRMDMPGLLLLAAAVLLFTVPLVLGQDRGWPLWCWVALAASALLVAAFTGYEARLSRRGGAPLIAPRVVRAPGMPVAVVRLAVAMAVNGGFLFVLALHTQSALGYSALRAGLTFAPAAVAFGVTGLNWRRLPRRWQPGLVPGGFVLAAVSFAGVGLALHGGHHADLGLYASMVGVGVGLSLAYSPALARALETVRQEDAADASGVLVTSGQIGLLVGVAALGALYLGMAGDVPAGDSAGDALLATALAMAGTSLGGALVVGRRR